MSERTRIGLLLAVAMLVYANALLNSFTYDDFLYVLNNPGVTSATLKGFFEPTKVGNVFRPVTFATFALNWALGNVHAWGYHLLNLLLHAAVTLLLYLVLRTLLESVARGETVAFAAALLFAVHPIHTEAVASIVGRSELLATGFLLVAWLLHLQDRQVPALACFVLALMSKESAVAFLPLALAGDYVRGKLKPLVRYGWIALVAVLYVGVLWKAQGGRFGELGVDFLDNPLTILPTKLRILNALRIAWKYVWLLVFPAKLSYDYSYNAIRLYADWRHTLPAAVAAVVVLGLWAWTVWKRQAGWVLAGAIYLAGFAVTANVLVPTGTIMGERLAYLPSAGFCLLVALIWIGLEKYRPKIAWAVLVAILAAFGARTIIRNRDWRSNFTLYSAAERVVPGDARMHANLGGFYMDSGQLEAARTELQTALRIYPDFPDALEFYGLTEARLGHDQEALPLLERALSSTRKESTRYNDRAVNLAALLIRLGQNDQAFNILNKVIQDSPECSRAWSNRAVIYYRRGDLASAQFDAQTSLHLEPGNAQARDLLSALAAPKAAVPK